MSGAGQTTAGPNVILILTDDQGYSDLGYFGNELIDTPQTDRLFETGAAFTDFHVSPTCSPTRAALMTGRHNLRTGVWHTVQGRSILHENEVTMADVFQSAGYRTGIFGKWHLGDNYPHRPQDRGFDNTLIHGGGGIGQTPDYWGNDYFDDVYLSEGSPVECDGYCTDVWFTHAIEFIDNCVDEDVPFFCYLPTNAPHRPYQVPDEYADRYRGTLPEEIARFYGMITNIDDNLGRLRNHLRELNIEDDTILLYLSDNGSSSPYHNPELRGHKGSQYDGGHRVPCVINWPDRFDRSDIDHLSAHYDLLPTLIDLCDIEEPDCRLDGRSLTPLLAGHSTWSDRTIVIDSQRIESPTRFRNCSVMTDRWRLIDGTELYDVSSETSQQTDVSDKYPEVVSRLRSAYLRWWDDVDDRFDQPVRIHIGSEANPIELTCMDWHECDTIPWHHGHILEALPANGYWTVEVTVGGTYMVELRRWPREADAPIDGVPTTFDSMNYGYADGWSAEATAIDPDLGVLDVGTQSYSQSIPSGTSAVAFDVELDPGPTTIQTAFLEPNAPTRGAYYVYITFQK